VVYDRVTGTPLRLMPNPLDVAFAALHNDGAARLLQSELDNYPYAGALESMRILADAHGNDFWSANLYNVWLSALRSLSPDAAASGLPRLTGTQAWNERILSTQLASWAQLRHDTILYVKPSYTAEASCVYPSAYVDPYPAFFETLIRFADRGIALADVLASNGSDDATERTRQYFTSLKHAMTELDGMAKAELAGTPLSDEQMTFINDAVHDLGTRGCTSVGPHFFDGWFAKLQYGPNSAGLSSADYEPTIADVHTQPTDATGHDVGRVLHVGTGMPRLMVASVDTCQGPRAYAGVVLSYYEKTTDNYNRLDDSTWAGLLSATPAPDEVAWTADFTSQP
jgi:hypothetical protein